MKIGVLFVCLGNICRSPAAEGSFKNLIKNRKLESNFYVDSCGTSNYHIGENPHKNTIAAAKEKGIILSHKSRQLIQADFEKFDYILAMDQNNLDEILSQKYVKNIKNMVYKLRIFQSNVFKESDDVPDPYYGTMENFRNVQNIVDIANEELLNFILKDKKLV